MPPRYLLALLPNFNLNTIAENVGFSVISGIVIFVLLWFRSVFLPRLLSAWRWMRAFFARKRFVLVWIDDEDKGYAGKLIEELRKRESSDLIFHEIKSPGEVLHYPRSKKRVGGIVLLNTDVSKLAEDLKSAGRIEKRLRTFVARGGGLVGSHDLIYRRVRSKALQSVFGCEITNFLSHKRPPVPYRLNPDHPDHALATDLPESFTLRDDEICWGTWPPDATIVYTTDDEYQRPLVVCRRHSQGRVVWLNSGDKGDSLCASIAEPEENFVLLLRNALRWVRESA